MKTLKKLYKFTSKGLIQEWQIYVEKNAIHKVYGLQKGKKQHITEEITKGKNIGRANETTPEEQAKLEAIAIWTRKKEKDYRESIEELSSKEKTSSSGGYLPMLAHSYKKHAEKHLKYPCYIQPKLDGLRCISTKSDKGVQLWFRSGKEIVTMGHIADSLDLIMKEGDILDGELYIHNEDFNSFTGAIRGNKNLKSEIIKNIQYHIYDCPRIRPYKENKTFDDRFSLFDVHPCMKNIKKVATIKVSNFEEAMVIYDNSITDGYEGIMFKNIDMPYEQKRSYNLLKYKEFIEDEFIIIGAIEGKGYLTKHVGSFICKIEEGRIMQDMGGKSVTYKRELDNRPEKEKGTVNAKLMGKTSQLKHLFYHPEEYIGKPLTIKYQNLSIYGIPRFGVGKSIRFDK